MACLTLRGRHLVNLQTGLRHDRHGRAARLPHDQRGLQVLGEKKTFHDANGGMMPRQHVPQRLRDLDQAPGMLPGGGTGNRALGQRFRVRLGQPDHAITGSPQGRVQAKKHLVRRPAPGAALLGERPRGAPAPA